MKCKGVEMKSKGRKAALTFHEEMIYIFSQPLIT